MRSRAGFTLLELVIAITVISVLASSGVHMVLTSLVAVEETERRIGAYQIARIALQSFRNDVAAIATASNSDIIVMTPTTFTFRKVGGLWVTYAYAANAITRNAVPVAHEVESCSLVYFGAGGSTASIASDLRRVSLRLEVRDEDQSVPLESEVSLRNVGQKYMNWMETAP